MEHLSSDMEQQNQQVQWQRDKVQDLCSKGYSQRDITKQNHYINCNYNTKIIDNLQK
jgi:hypothetical protein